MANVVIMDKMVIKIMVLKRPILSDMAPAARRPTPEALVISKIMRVSNTKIKHEGIVCGFNGESYPLMTAMMVYIESGAKPLAIAQVGTIPSPAIRIN